MRYLLLNQNGENHIGHNSGNYCTMDYVTTMDNVQCYSSSKKVKRFRSAFTTDQVNYLEQQFKKFPYIGNSHRKEVAIALNIPERAVKIWFQNRRMKEKKETGTKEFDNDQNNRKSVECAKDQLNNVSSQSANDQRQYSLPLLTEMRKPVVTQNGGTMKTCETTLKQAKGFMEGQYYGDNTNRKIQPITVASRNPSPSNYKGSAEFSIDLCKKYKSEPASKQDLAAQVSPKVKIHPKQDQDRKPINQVSDEQILPEDLSSTRPNSIQSAGPLKYVANNPGYFSVLPTISPLYTQPYISPGGVLWKQINMMPVVSTASAPLATPVNQLGLVPGTPIAPRRNCNCDCHMQAPVPVALQQTAPNPQYIITALPFQNPSAKF